VVPWWAWPGRAKWDGRWVPQATDWSVDTSIRPGWCTGQN
jgi:hypothetical protein